MTIRESKTASHALLEIGGRVDSLNAETLKDRVQEIGRREARILVDCTALEYIGSAGLGALLVLLKLVRKQGGTLGLFGLSPHIAEVFAIAGFDKLFPIFPDLESARQAAT